MKFSIMSKFVVILNFIIFILTLGTGIYEPKNLIKKMFWVEYEKNDDTSFYLT